MKIKPGFHMRNVAGAYVVVPTGVAAGTYSNMLVLNQVGAFLYQQLQKEASKIQLRDALLETYAVESQRAETAVENFVHELSQAGILME